MFVRGKVFHYDFHYVSTDFNIYDNVFAFRNSDGHSTLDTAIEYDMNIYPESNRTMANRGNFNPADLLHFDSPADKFSRPSSATYENVASPSGFQKNVRSKASRQTLWRQMILNLLIEKSS